MCGIVAYCEMVRFSFQQYTRNHISVNGRPKAGIEMEKNVSNQNCQSAKTIFTDPTTKIEKYFHVGRSTKRPRNHYGFLLDAIQLAIVQNWRIFQSFDYLAGC